jgi:L-threonylcarbamoyladenylate synthase
LVATAEIEAVIGPIVHGPSPIANAPLKSPGLLDRHYAPKTPLECIAEDDGSRVRHLGECGLRLGLLTYLPDRAEPGIKTIVLPRDPSGYAAGLYAALHELDAAGLDRIIVTLPPNTAEWLAVRDRLQRARTT